MRTALEPVTEVSRISPSRLVVVVLAVVTGVYAYLRMFSGFSFYDDEGSLILMSRWLLDGHSVYGDFNSIYGPFYFLYGWLAHALLGGTASHSTSRLIAVAPWVLTCMLVFGYTLRSTGSRAAALAAWLAVLRTLAFFAAEPGHPQEICVLLMVALVAVGARSNLVPLAASGALVAALLLTKINLGVFAGAALLLACVHSLPAGRARNLLLAIVAAVCVAAPAMLMRPLLGTAWAQESCALLTLSILATAAVLAVRRPEFALDGRRWLALALGFVACVSVVLTWSLGRGASLGAMAQSIILDNLAQSHTWTVPLGAGKAGVLAGIAGALLAVLWLAGWQHRAFEWLRLAVGSSTLVLVLIDRQAAAFAIALPFVWMVMLPGADLNSLWRRKILACVTVMQAMAVYPVAGSQLRFTLVPLTLAAAQMVWDAWTVLGREAFLGRAKMRLAERSVIACVLVGYAFGASRAFTYYREFTPLDLKGTAGIRIDPTDRATYHWIVSSVRRSCDSLVSFPAMHSIYFWTGMVPPVYPDVDGWQAYTNAQRQRVERQILSSPHACVLVIDKLMDFWLPAGQAGRSTMMEFVRENFAEMEQRDGFHLLVRKRFAAAPGSSKTDSNR